MNPSTLPGVSSAVDADAHRHADENKHHAYLFDHESSYRFMRAARRRALFPKKASPVLLRVPRPDVSRETFVPLSHCNAMNCFTWNIASGRARAVAHMTLPERNTRRHDADEAPRANPCARGIDRNRGTRGSGPCGYGRRSRRRLRRYVRRRCSRVLLPKLGPRKRATCATFVRCAVGRSFRRARFPIGRGMRLV